jgi:hypothetical protein
MVEPPSPLCSVGWGNSMRAYYGELGNNTPNEMCKSEAIPWHYKVRGGRLSDFFIWKNHVQSYTFLVTTMPVRLSSKIMLHTIVIHKVTMSSPSLWGLLSTPYPLFQWYPQSKDILINLSMKCYNSVWNAHTQHLMHKVRD